MTLIIQRLIPAGSPNKNTGKVYPELEDKIREMLEKSNFRAPVDMADMSTNNDLHITPDPASIIGYLIAVDDKTATVELNSRGETLYTEHQFDHMKLQFCYVIDAGTDAVVMVSKPNLVKSKR